MRAPSRMAIAVRRPDGKIVVDARELSSLKDRYPILKWPVIRGMVNFIETLLVGFKSLMDSAEMSGEQAALEEYKPSKFEKMIADKTGKKAEDVMMLFALVLALGLAVLFFVVLPALLTGLLKSWITNRFVLGLIEGAIRLAIFLCYLILVTKIRDIQRVFEYHGAEHKTIHCYEHGEELNVSNARKYSTLHPRCGTAFLLVVMVVGIVVFSALSWDNVVLRIVMKILLLPFVAGVSYEIIRLAGRTSWPCVRLIRFPGRVLQRLTTREPDDGQLEVAIRAFVEAAGIAEEEIHGAECDGSFEARVCNS